MTTIRNLARVGGSVHDVTHLESLDPDDCHVIILSERSLYILNNLSLGEVGYLARYAKQYLPGNLFIPVESGDEWEEFVRDAQNAFGLEVIDVTCDIVGVLESLVTQIETLNTTVTEIAATLATMDATIAGLSTTAPEWADDVEEILDAVNVILGGVAILP
jgi:hypothetical protein